MDAAAPHDAESGALAPRALAPRNAEVGAANRPLGAEPGAANRPPGAENRPPGAARRRRPPHGRSRAPHNHGRAPRNRRRAAADPYGFSNQPLDKITKTVQAKVREPFEMYSPTAAEIYEANLLSRALSFANYTGDNEYELAIAGWSGTDHGNIIMCENCLAYAKDVEISDNAILLHKIISPDCEFVREVKLSDEIINDVDTQEMISRCLDVNFK